MDTQFVDRRNVVEAQLVPDPKQKQPSRNSTRNKMIGVALACGLAVLWLGGSIANFKTQARQKAIAAELAEKARREKELFNAERKQELEEQRLAQAQRDEAEAPVLMEKFVKRLDGIANVTVFLKRVGVKVKGELKTATITVAPDWHTEAYQNRLQLAQALQNIWAQETGGNPDHARLSLIDQLGNEVGGSRVWAGSLIWVQER